MKRVFFGSLILASMAFASFEVETKYNLNVRAEPNTQSGIVNILRAHRVVEVTGEEHDGFYELVEGGFIGKRHVTPVSLATHVDPLNTLDGAQELVVKSIEQAVTPVEVETMVADEALPQPMAEEAIEVGAPTVEPEVEPIKWETKNPSMVGLPDEMPEPPAKTEEEAEKHPLVAAKEPVTGEPKKKGIFGWFSAKKEPAPKPSPKKTEAIEIIPEESSTFHVPPKVKVDSILLHSAEMARAKPAEAMIEHLTKLPSPIPVRSRPKYARVLLFPYTTQTGDYYDYSFAWVKIKDEQFVLGNREGKR